MEEEVVSEVEVLKGLLVGGCSNDVLSDGLWDFNDWGLE